MTRDHDAAVVVRSAISLAGTLELRVVAVGVGDEATLERLRALGCAGVQGDVVGPPMTADKLEPWLAAPPRPAALREPDEAPADVAAMAPA